MRATWRYIEDDGVTASFGLAADEFLMQAAADGGPLTLRLYTYRPHAALVGRFQNVEAELRLSECRRLGVQVNRRLTGGGAIVMGDQQLGLAFACSLRQPGMPQQPRQMFQVYSQAIIDGLRRLGIEASFRPKNDIEVGGRKIAGLGLCLDEEDVLLFHASLLVDFDVSLMLRLLNLPTEKIADKEVASFEERLTTIRRVLRPQVTVGEVREAVRRGFERAFGVRLALQPFEAKEVAAIQRLEESRYARQEWVYQRTPTSDATGMSLCKTEAGLLRVYVSLAGDVLKSVLVSGDFFSTMRALTNLEARLKWSRAAREEIDQAVQDALAWQGQSSWPAQDSLIDGLSPTVLTDAIMAAVADAKRRTGLSR